MRHTVPELLEEIEALQKQGPIISLAFVAVTKDSFVHTGKADTCVLLLGGLDMCTAHVRKDLQGRSEEYSAVGKGKEE